ncbi:MAG: alpha/beta hydrolase, partial [Verrucomicrobiota bacterium]
VATTISYRLSGETPFPAQIHDCKAAVRYLRANAAELGIDTDRIGAIGLSAGGHLTALLATSNDISELEGNGGNPDFSSTIQAAIPMGAQSNLMSERIREVSKTRDIYHQFLGGSQDDYKATYQLASPLTHLDKNDPPQWFITGGEDDPSTHAETFRKKMKQLKIDSGLTVIDGAPHGFIGKQAFFDQAVQTATTFFKDTLKQPTP